MKRLLALQNRAAALAKKMREVSDAAGDEQLSDEQAKQFESYKVELAEVQSNIDREKGLIEAEKSLSPVLNPMTPPEPKSPYPDDFIRHGKLQHFKDEKTAYGVGMFYLATLFGNERAKSWCKDNGMLRKPSELTNQELATVGGINTIGGYFIQNQLVNTIIDIRDRYGLFRQVADVVPMSSATLSQPRATGGTTVQWIGERGTYAEQTDTTYDMITLVAKKLGCLLYYTKEVSEDASIAIAEKLTYNIGYAYAKEEDRVGFSGTGISTDGGIVGLLTKINDGSHAASISTSQAGNISFETLDIVDFTSVIAKLPEQFLDNAAWYISGTGFAASMERLMFTTGGATKADVAGGVQRTFLGFPVRTSVVFNRTLGSDASQIKCLFGDISKAVMLGDRRQLEMETSDQIAWTQDLIAIKARQRLDINVHGTGDSTNAGSVIALKTNTA